MILLLIHSMASMTWRKEMPKKIPTVPPKLLRRQGKGHTSYSSLKWLMSLMYMRRSLVLLVLLKQVLVNELDGHLPVGLAVLKVWDAKQRFTISSYSRR